MSIQNEITRINTARDKIRTKFVEIGISENTANITQLADDSDEIVSQGAINATVEEGESFTIPKGWHNGSGTVSGVAGGGNYSLQVKQGIIPTKTKISVSADAGYYGLSGVEIEPIPENYNDTSSVNAEVGDVLSGKIVVDADGNQIVGTMTDNGAVEIDLNTEKTSYTIPEGYHNGEGTISIDLEERTIIPTVNEQEIIPNEGKLISKVTVRAIPDDYKNITDSTVTADKMLEEEIGYGVIGEDEEGDPIYGQIIGTIPSRGEISQVLDVENQSYTVQEGYYTGGTVSFVAEEKTVTPSKTQQIITPLTGKLLTSVTVEAIPEELVDPTDATAVAENILFGKTAYALIPSEEEDGEATYGKVTGSMPNNGGIEATITGLTDEASSYTIPTGYTTGGTVSLTNDIEDMLAAI